MLITGSCLSRADQRFTRTLLFLQIFLMVVDPLVENLRAHDYLHLQVVGIHPSLV